MDCLHGLDAFAALLTPDGTILDINDTALGYCGKPRQDLIGTTLAECGCFCLSSDSQSRLRDAIERTRDAGTSRGDVTIRDADGATHHFELTLIRQRGAGAGVSAILAIGVDLAVRDQTGFARNLAFLGKLGDATRSLADPAKIMEVTSGMLGEYLGVSRAAYADVRPGNDSFSIRHDYTKNCSTAVGDYSLDLFGARAAAAMRKGETLVIRNVSEELGPDSGADTFHAIEIQAIICCPLRKYGKLVAMMAVHQVEPRDWTQDEISLVRSVVDRSWASIERARAQTRLQRTERQFEDLFEFAPDPMVMTNAQGLVALVNKRAENLFNYSRREIVGQPFTKLVADPHDGEGLSLQRAFAASVRLQDTIFGDQSLQGRRKDGTRFPVEISLSPIEMDQGPMLGIALRDTTERKELEARLQQTMKLETVGQLAGGIAHDFNNLLTVINATAELIVERTPADQLLAEEAVTILRAGEQAATLTRQLLALSRQQVLQPITLDLNQVLEEMEPVLRSVCGECIETKMRVAPQPVMTRVDRTQIDQVLLNIAANSRQAMPEGGTVIFQTDVLELDERFVSGYPDLQAGTYAYLSVTDTGCGMDEATRRQVFEPFFTTREPGQGAGLGLSTVYGIVRQSGGAIVAASESGSGTIISIYLPAVVEATARAVGPVQAAQGGNETILLVENEKDIRNVAKIMLERRGYSVLSAKSGADALEIFRDHRDSISLILTDVVMPGMSGPALVSAARELRPGIKVLYMTGYAPAEIAHHGLDDERHFRLSKPFSLAELSKAIRQCLDT